MRPSHGIALAFLLGACGQHKAIDAAPPWSTQKGKDEARVEMATALMDKGAAREALAVLNALRQDGYDTPEVNLLHGRALWKLELYSEAEPLLAGARARMPRDSRPHEALGLLYADTDRTEDAITSLRRALDLDPSRAATWNNIGFLLLSAKRYDEALTALQEAVSRDGTDARYRNNLGFALAATGRTADALRAFQSVSSRDEAHANLGLALEMAGRGADAMAEYQKALEYNPGSTSAKEALSRLQTPQDIP